MREPHDAALDAPDAKRRRGADGSPSSSEDPDWTHVLVYNVSLSDVVLAAPYRDAAAAHRLDGFDGAVHDGRPLSHAASSCAVAPEDPGGYPGAREAVALEFQALHALRQQEAFDEDAAADGLAGGEEVCARVRRVGEGAQGVVVAEVGAAGEHDERHAEKCVGASLLGSVWSSIGQEHRIFVD